MQTRFSMEEEEEQEKEEEEEGHGVFSIRMEMWDPQLSKVIQLVSHSSSHWLGK